MKNILIIALFVLSINTISFGQKTTTYISTGDGDQYPRLESVADFKKDMKYSSIKESLILSTEMVKRDTEIRYILIEKSDRASYNSIKSEKNKKHFIKKYCEQYTVQRKTPKLYSIN